MIQLKQKEVIYVYKEKYSYSSLFLIIAVGLKRYGVTAPDLTWNMFLALVALDFAILTNHTKSHILKVIAGLLWLFFYPNTFTW